MNTEMISLTKFILAIVVVAYESTHVVHAAVKFMQHYKNVHNDIIKLTNVSLVGNGSTCSVGQCASSCNSHSSSCDGFLLMSHDDDDSMKMRMCQLLKMQESVAQSIHPPTDRTRLFLRSDVFSKLMTETATVQYKAYHGNCSFPFTFNGLLYYNCTTTGSSSSCFDVNRMNLSCDDPSYLALEVPMNLAVANQSVVATMSVFGWITLQQRTPVNPSFNWSRGWSEYRNGFGSIGTNFWLGLERIYLLTSSGKYRLRIEMQTNVTGRWYSDEYWSFFIGSETAKKY